MAWAPLQFCSMLGSLSFSVRIYKPDQTKYLCVVVFLNQQQVLGERSKSRASMSFSRIFPSPSTIYIFGISCPGGGMI